MYLNSDTAAISVPFAFQSTRGARSWVKSSNSKYDLWFKFCANGYLKLSVSRNLAFQERGHLTVYCTGDVRVRWDLERFGEGKERDGGRETEEGQESPVLREMWFEINHPICLWN